MNCPEIDRPTLNPYYVSDDMNTNAGVYVLNTLLSGPFFVNDSSTKTISYNDETKDICPREFPISLTELQSTIEYLNQNKNIRETDLYPFALELAGYHVDEISLEDFTTMGQPEQSVIGILYSFVGKDPRRELAAGAGMYKPQLQWTALKRTTESASWFNIAQETWTAYTPIVETMIEPTTTSLETIVNPNYVSARTIALKYFEEILSIFFVYSMDAKPSQRPVREDYVDIKVFPNPVHNGEKARFKISTHTSPDSVHSAEAWMFDLNEQIIRDTLSPQERDEEMDGSYPPYESYRIPIDIQTRPENLPIESTEERTLVGGKKPSKPNNTISRISTRSGRKTKRRAARK